jgi:hypothetical protein
MHYCYAVLLFVFMVTSVAEATPPSIASISPAIQVFVDDYDSDDVDLVDEPDDDDPSLLDEFTRTFGKEVYKIYVYPSDNVGGQYLRT